MQSSAMMRILSVLTIAVILSSCVTIPVPESPSDTLAVLVFEKRSVDAGSTDRTYKIILERTGSGVARTFVAGPTRKYYISGLEPGHYTVSHQYIPSSSVTIKGRNPVVKDFAFAISAGEAKVLDHLLYFHFEWLAERNSGACDGGTQAAQLDHCVFGGIRYDRA